MEERSSKTCFEAAEEAWQHIEGDCGACHLEPGHFLQLLELAALCPIFSQQLFCAGGSFQMLYCSEDAFGGCADRQQFFRNQTMALAHEKAEVISAGMDALAEVGEEDLDDSLAWNAVCAETGEDDDTPVSYLTLESEQAPELVDYQIGDIFFMRRRAEPLYPVPAPIAEGDCSDKKQAGLGLARVALGVVNVIKVPQGSRLSLLGISPFPLTLGGEAGDARGEEYQVIPTDMLPTVFKLRQRAIHRLCQRCEGYSEFVQRFVFGGITSACLRPEGLLRLPAAAATDVDPRLNHSQRIALEAAASRSITLIQGPPGTGKTDVAVAIVMLWLRQDAETEILVATGTHTAKNLLAKRLRDRGLKIRQRKDQLLRKEPPLDAVPVFVETVYMAATPDSRKLPRVIIDESSQITLSAALVALGQHCKQLVMIGDPKQLGPVSVLGFAGLDQAPLARERWSVFEEALQKHELLKEGCVRLDVQYRMHPKICKYPSDRFYGGDLTPHPSTYEYAALPRCWLWPEAGCHPVVFIDTAGADGCAEEMVSLAWSVSFENTLEASIVERVIEALAKAGVSLEDIGVATAYNGQRELLLRRLHGLSLSSGKQRRLRAAKVLLASTDHDVGMPHPHVRTIDGFQGGENDFIIFSAVRSNPESRTGFVDDARRICVLLTRARRGLIIVGDSDTLRGSEEWKAWLEDEEGGRAHVIPWREFSEQLRGDAPEEPLR